MDDTVARYDPVEAIEQIADATRVDPRTIAQILEGEFDYMACLGLFGEQEVDEDQRAELEALRRSNQDILEGSEGSYDVSGAVLFIQRNRGIDKDTAARVLEANYQFMDERGFLDEDWGEDETPPSEPPAAAPPRPRERQTNR